MISFLHTRVLSMSSILLPIEVIVPRIIIAQSSSKLFIQHLATNSTLHFCLLYVHNESQRWEEFDKNFIHSEIVCFLLATVDFSNSCFSYHFPPSFNLHFPTRAKPCEVLNYSNKLLIQLVIKHFEHQLEARIEIAN